jgi:hypothetical protein
VEKQAIGICYECSTKNMDSSQKTVYYCEKCQKWFCELHREPKFPYFVDWETQFDVQGNPEVKAFFYSEYGRQDGHADLEYLRRKIMEMELEEEYQNFLIKSAMDNMNLYGKPLRQIKVQEVEKKPQILKNKSDYLHRELMLISLIMTFRFQRVSIQLMNFMTD